MREIVKVRMVAGSLVVSLPQSVLEPVGLREGDRVVVEAAPPRRLLITKEGNTMTSTQHLEMQIDLLEKKKKAVESDLTYKERQYNSNMPCDDGMSDNDVAILMMSSLVRDRDRIDVEIAEKRIELYEVQGGELQEPQSPPIPDEVASSPSKVERGWYHWVDGDGQGYFLAFVNAKGSCSMRQFNSESGVALPKGENPKGDFRDQFSQYLDQATPLNLSRQPNLDRDCKDRLPSTLLSELQRQIKRTS